MEDKVDESLAKWLTLYELPEDKAKQQPYIERAEEDLLCAVSLYRRGACGYLPLNNVCYLLHQAIEKWLKLFIAVGRVEGVPTRGQHAHDLRLFLTAIEALDPEFLRIRGMIEAVDGQMMDHRFPGSLRYEATKPETDQHVETLMSVAFRTRRLVKRCLKLLEEEA